MKTPLDTRGTPSTTEVDTASHVTSNPAAAVAGGAAGAALGAVAGIAAGPVGSLAGAVVGAVAGGIASARTTAGAGGQPVAPTQATPTASMSPLGQGPDKAEVPDVKGDHAAEQEAERAQAALDNVREVREKAPPGAAGEPSWPTGGNVSQGPRERGGA